MCSAVVKLASLGSDGDPVRIPDPSGDVHLQPTSVQEHSIVGLQGTCWSEKISYIWKEIVSLSFTLMCMFYCLTQAVNVLTVDKTLLSVLLLCSDSSTFIMRKG